MAHVDAAALGLKVNAMVPMILCLVLTAAALAGPVMIGPSGRLAQTDRYAALDQLLDTYVRDGGVYYKALRMDRARLDRFVQSLDLPAAELSRWSVDERKAFW